MKTVPVGRVIDLFLAHVSESAKASTAAWYAAFLLEFRLFAGERRLRDVTPALVHKWLAKRYGDSSPSTRHDAARSVCRLVNWSVEEGLLAASPLKRMRKPSQSPRERVLSGAEYATLLKAATPALKDVIKFLWHTGARPQEMRAIEAGWVGDRKVIFPQLGSKGEKKRRVIYLDSMASGILTRLSARTPHGPVFRTLRGKPWQKQALVNRFERLREVAKVPGVCAYTLRHTWITRMLEKGVPVATVAALAGNSPQTVMRVYSHVADNEAHLRSFLD